MTTQTATHSRLSPRFIYAADVAVSAIMGVVLFAAATPLTELVGWSLPASFISTLGLLLLPWAAFNLWIARATVPPRAAVLGNIAGDSAWVLGSIALIIAHAPSLSTIGMALLVGQALSVSGVLAIKLAGARALL